jgi:hypothetical protein
MITRQTIILMTMTVVAFLYLAAFERDHSPTPRPELPPLPAVDVGLVRAVVVELQNETQGVRVERSEDGWEIKNPFTYPAQSSRVEALLSALATLQPAIHIPETDMEQLNEYGLQSPRKTLRLESYTTTNEIRIGEYTPRRNRVYIAVSGVPGVYVAPTHFLNTLPRKVENWRDPRLAPLGTAREDLDNLTVTADGELLLALRRNITNKIWKLDQRGQPHRADPERIRRFLNDLQSWEVAHFLPTDGVPSLIDMDLQPPEMKLRVAQGTNQVVAIDFGRPHPNTAGLVYARNIRHDTLLTVKQSVKDQLKVDPWELFGDHRLIDAFETNEIARLEVHTRTEQFALEQDPTNHTWRLVKPTQQPADQELVQTMLKQLAALEATDLVKDVVTDYAPYQLDEPVASYSLWRRPAGGSVTNTLMARVDFGKLDLEKGMVFARRDDEKMVYELENAQLEVLPDRYFRLRDRRLWRLSNMDVSKVTATLKGKAPVEFARNIRKRWSSPGMQLTLQQDAVMNAALDALGSFSAGRWLVHGDDKLDEPTFGFLETAEKLDLQVKIGNEVKPHTLLLGKVTLLGERFAAARGPDGQFVVFTFPEKTYSQVLNIYRLAQ